MKSIPRPPRHLRAAGLISAALCAATASVLDAQVCIAPANEGHAGQVLRSLAYGSTPDSLADLVNNGINAWILEQLNPAGIDESGNQQLIDVLAGIHVPVAQGDPDSTVNMLANYVVARSLYSEKQLLERLTQFWDNHFSTSVFAVSSKVADDSIAIWFEYLENEAFRTKALKKFKNILRASATSPAMLYYLDNVSNTVQGPNENYARELLELHTVGIDNGYTEDDVREVARAFTGWTVCQVDPADFGNPGAPPITCSTRWEAYFNGDVDSDGFVDSQDEAIILANFGPAVGPAKRYDIFPPPSVYCVAGTGLPSNDSGDGVVDNLDLGVATGNLGTTYFVDSFCFDPLAHDYGLKKIFSDPGGIPELVLPLWPQVFPTGGNPQAVADGYMVLDHLAASDQAAEFISTKLFNYFVNDRDLAVDDPTLRQDLINNWQATDGNIGRLLRLLFSRTVAVPGYDMRFDKVRTGLEKSLALVRALGGSTPPDPLTAWERIDELRDWMDARLNHPLFRHAAPDGFEEAGDKITDTGTMLAWWQLNQHVWDLNSPHTHQPPRFDYDLDGLMIAAGVNLDDADEVTCFLLRLLVQDNFTATDKDLVKQFLTTTPGGAPFTLDYTNNLGGWLRQVHKTAGYAACLPQFIEQ